MTSGTGRPRCIAHLDMDAFYASVEQLRDPRLRGKPVVVGGAGPRGVVAAASYEARRFGVRSAMPGGAARRLCPQAIFLPPDFEAYRRFSALVFEVLARHTPVIEPLSLDEAFLDLSANPDAREYRERTARQIKSEVLAATGGLTSSIGVATCKVVAKVASDYRKPDGLVVVPPGEEAAFLATQPLRVLPGLGPAAEQRLAGLGLRTVGDLARLPHELLVARLGNQGPALQALALGVDPRPVTVPGAPKSISREVTFDQDVSDVEYLRRQLRVLAQDVTRSLRRQGLWARTVRLKLRFAGFETHTFQATLENPTDLDDEFLRTADRLLREALPQPRPVRLCGIGATGIGDSVQADLFDTRRARSRTLDATLDQLRDRFGARVVVRGPALPGDRPARQLDFSRDDIDAVRDGDP